MPSASDDDLARAIRTWGSEMPDPAEKFLLDRGYVLTHDWHWLAPPSPNYKPSEEEEFALRFLHDEWDYGDIVEL